MGAYAFDAFGLRTGTDATTDPYSGFGGGYGYYADAETGLSLLGHRYYDTGTGRFVTRDPIGYDGGINLYGYTGNNPISRADPTGFNPKQGEAPGQVTNPADSGVAATLVFDWASPTNNYYQYKLTLDPGYQTVPDAVDIDWMKTSTGWVHLLPDYKAFPNGIRIPNVLFPGGYTVRPDGSPSPSIFKESCSANHYSKVFGRSVNWPQGFGITPGALMKPLTTKQALDMGFIVPNPPTLQDKLDGFFREMDQTIHHGF